MAVSLVAVTAAERGDSGLVWSAVTLEVKRSGSAATVGIAATAATDGGVAGYSLM